MLAEEALAGVRTNLMRTPGVVGVGVGERRGRPVIVVMTEGRASSLSSLPSQVSGYPVEVEEVGVVEAW
jgi:hypothetical protein